MEILQSTLAHTEGILRSAQERFAGHMVLATSLGPQSSVLIDMIARLKLCIPAILIDTGLLFEETHALRRTIERRYAISIHAITPERDLYEQERSLGSALWRQEPSHCCNVRKVQPMQQALQGLEAWITGIRGDQTQSRAQALSEEWDDRFDLVKINPLLAWSHTDVRAYLRAHDVPYNELLDKNYSSVGCTPCTTPAFSMNERAGRWNGHVKTECGLHLRNAGDMK